jgi:PAS domain S-box-containing protein
VARLTDLSELLDLAHDAILVRDPDNRIVYANRQATQLYGWSRGELLGQVTHDLFQTRFPVSKEAVDAALARTGWWEGRLLHRRADGAIRTIDSRQALRCDDLDRPRAIIEINRDVTTQEQARQELERLGRLQDRERIAQQLGDGILRELFATGLHLQATASAATDSEVAARITEAIARLDQMIAELRRHVFALDPG